MMTDEQLSSLGVSTIGDRLRLKSFCSPLASTSSKKPGPYNSERQGKIDKVKEIIHQNKRSKSADVKDSTSGRPPKVRQKETLKFEFGWKHWSNGKFKQKRSDHGGGKRRIDVPRDSGYEDCLQIAKKLFFPRGVSSEGHEDEMYISLGNYAGDPVDNMEDGNDILPFSAERYKSVTGFALPSIYLLSRSKESVDYNDSDDDLVRPAFESTSNDESENVFQSSALIGSSSEREVFFNDLEQQVAESAAADKAKQAAKEMIEQERRSNMENEIAKVKEEAETLEKLRNAREQRVPPEPSDDGVLISVRHIDLGVVTRAFPLSCTMSAVYDWIGSLSRTPKHFRLSKAPNSTMYPDQSVTEADRELLSMFEESVPLPLAPDENEVAFYAGESEEPLAFEATLLDISNKPPEVLLEDDVEATEEEQQTEEGQRTLDSYASLEARRKQQQFQLEARKPEKIITISRHNITELMSIYEDQQISQHNLLVYFDEDSGSGDGVVREMFSVFWDRFVMLHCEGSSQFTISVTPAMQPQDYVTVGRIMTHGFVLCGSFPVQLARASLHQALFGTVSNECLLDSFLMLLPEKERETMLLGLNGTKPFPLEEIVDILDDFKETTMPSSANLRELLLKVATAEFVTKPFLPLLKLREGMGDFWNGTTKEELDSLYDMCCPTPTRVACHLSSVPGNPQEEKVYRWLKRYARNLESKMAVKFVRFCTASDVLLPEKSIAVRFEHMPEGAIRPMARTCFRSLTVACNYRSFNHLKENFDFYLRDPTQWDLSD